MKTNTTTNKPPDKLRAKLKARIKKMAGKAKFIEGTSDLRHKDKRLG